MRTRLLRLALFIGLITALVSVYAGPRHSAAAAGGVTTFVTDVGRLGDKGFNDLGWLGTQTGAKQAGWVARVIETTASTDYDKNLSTAAQQSKLVVSAGFLMGDAVQRTSKKYPKVKFTIIDYSYSPSLPNVLGNIFTPEQSSYLAGIVAAGISKTHTIGFVGGLNVPLIVAFYAGFRAGALSYDRNVKVLAAYTGSFTDQSKGKTSALQEINSGADVIFAAAGASGNGALAAAAQKGLYGIGVDADQHALHPDSIITSVVKHVEVAAAAAVVAVAKGTFKGGTKLWNLANNGVGLASYHNLASKVPAKVQAAVDKARRGIISGDIKVPVTVK